MIKLIATDIDGTLLPPAAGEIPEDLVKVMRSLMEYGVRIMIASGVPQVFPLKMPHKNSGSSGSRLGDE